MTDPMTTATAEMFLCQRDDLANELERVSAERDTFESALREIERHHAMPAGESWEDAYNEVCSFAIEALDDQHAPPRRAA